MTLQRPPSRQVEVLKVSAAGSARAPDRVVVEEPLEIRVAGDPLAVTMRTPGHDRELAMGWLFAEGVIASRHDVSALAWCGRPGEDGYGNVLEVTPSPGARLNLGDEDAPFVRRGTVTAACGVCGRRSIDDLVARLPARIGTSRIPLELLRSATSRLAGKQPVFSETGGTHAAVLLAPDGTVAAAHEDVGRHNAVDKVVGDRLLAGVVPLTGHVLVVSGRTSFEIVQKAAVAGIDAVCGVSAASSLAIDTAHRAGLVLCGFARDGEVVVYAGSERVD